MKIYFLFHSQAFWPSWESFWDACVADKNIETKMIYCPVKKQAAGYDGQFVVAEEFLKEKEIPYVNINDIDLFNDTPDVLVMQTPYDDWHREEKYSSAELKKTGAKLIYISYGLEFTENTNCIFNQFQRPFYKNMWRIYKFADFLIDDYQRFANITKDHVVCVGHPAFDALYKAKRQNLPFELLQKIGNRKIGVWHTHFPCLYSEKEGKKVCSTFSWQKNLQLLSHMLERKDIFWIFMAHHMFFDVFEHTFGVSKTEIETFKKKISEAENMCLWTGEYPDILAATNFVIGERSSVTMEAILLNKPVCYLEESPEIYNQFGKDCLDACYYANNMENVFTFIDDMLVGKDITKEARMILINKYFKPYFDGKCGWFIKENILSEKISVVMPVYNAEKYLKEAIDSVLNQTHENFEFLIIDDNSTDKTREIIQSYKDRRIKLIAGPCHGIAAALNVGLDKATGKYIARMDADDISLPERFATQVEFMEAHPEVGICAVKAEYFGNTKQKGMQFGVWWSRNNEGPAIKCGIVDFINTCMICHPSVMFNKELFDRYRLRYNEEYTTSEDQELWSRACLLFDIYIINKVLLHYRWGDNNATTKNAQKGIMQAMQSRTKLIQKLMPQYINTIENYEYFEKETYKINEAIMSMGKNEQFVYENNVMQVMKKSHIIKLFSFIPIYAKVQRGGQTTYKILGLPILRIRKFANGMTTKYYSLGVPFMKISIKNRNEIR